MRLSKMLVIPSALLMSAAIAGCVPGGLRHGWMMRGQVLAIDGSVATVCIGTSDGARVGQVLDVQRITMKPAPPKGTATFVRSDAGKVQIVDLFDEHYAHAKVLSGNPAINDVVELLVK